MMLMGAKWRIPDQAFRPALLRPGSVFFKKVVKERQTKPSQTKAKKQAILKIPTPQ